MCAHWLASGLVMPPRLATKLSGQIAGLIGLEQIKVLTIEEFSPHSGRWTCKGIGVSGFVDRALIDAHLAAPKPFFLVDLLDRTAAGAAVFLAPPDIGHANANGGLDLVVELSRLYRRLIVVSQAAIFAGTSRLA